MATLVKTPSGTWKAVIRKSGFPTATKTFRTKRDAEDWSRRTEDEMVRGVYIQRAPAERLTVADALKRYLAEVSPTKRPTSAASDARHANRRKRPPSKYMNLLALAGSTLSCSPRGIPLPRHTLLRCSQPHTMNALNAMGDASNGHADCSQPS